MHVIFPFSGNAYILLPDFNDLRSPKAHIFSCYRLNLQKKGPNLPFQSGPLYVEDHPKSAFNFWPGLNINAHPFRLCSK